MKHMEPKKLRVSFAREVKLVLTLKELYEEYGSYFLDWYFRPSILNYGIPKFIYENKKFENLGIEQKMKELSIFLIKPDTPSRQEMEKYDEILKNALKRKLFKDPETLHEKYALARYEVLRVVFGGLGWSILPEYKKKWKIDQELFGSFFNTNVPFCSLFPELEGNGEQFGTVSRKFFKPGNTYLVNPPFEKFYILWTCERLQEWLDDVKIKDVEFVVIIPVWDAESRKKLHLKVDYGDIPQLTEITKSKFVKSHSMTQMKFWDSTKNKIQHQKSFIHKIVLVK
jgi:hypothetical protein